MLTSHKVQRDGPSEIVERGEYGKQVHRIEERRKRAISKALFPCSFCAFPHRLALQSTGYLHRAYKANWTLRTGFGKWIQVGVREHHGLPTFRFAECVILHAPLDCSIGITLSWLWLHGTGQKEGGVVDDRSSRLSHRSDHVKTIQTSAI